MSVVNKTLKLLETSKKQLEVDHSQDAHMKMYMHGGFGLDYIIFYEWCPKSVGGNTFSRFIYVALN
jgi:hypothetical protein